MNTDIFDNSEITCENEKVLEALDRTLFEHVGESYQGGKTLFVFGPVNQGVKEISLQFPDDIITCRYSIDEENFRATYIYQYQAGKETSVGIEPNYIFNDFKIRNDKDHTTIMEIVLAFFKSLDKAIQSKNGEWKMEWFPGEVRHMFTYQGSKQKYKIVATKLLNNIDVCVYAKRQSEVWYPLGEGRPHLFDDLFFDVCKVVS